VAVGIGVLLRTTDGGATWNSQSAPWLLGVALADPAHGWAAGYSGTILRTSNGGLNWNAQSSAATTDDLDAVAFSSASDGWAVGSNGLIVHTLNGGGTWEIQGSGTTAYLSRVAFPSSSAGYVLGSGWGLGANPAEYGSVILRTLDGGSQWSTAEPLPTQALMRDLMFTTPAHGWVVGGNGTILVTSDAGATWSPQESGTTNELNGVSFPTALCGWVVGAGGVILHTSDGGTTWLAQDSGSTKPLLDVSFVDENNGWAVGSDYAGDNTLLHTDDGGAHWTVQGPGYLGGNSLVEVSFANSNVGWAVAEDWNGVILSTTDGGLTWTTKSVPNNAYGVATVDAETAWVVGQSGMILTTPRLKSPPRVSIEASPAMNEGDTLAIAGSFSDPEATIWTATVDYGDGSGQKPLALMSDRTFSLSHTYAREGTYFIAVRVKDRVGGVGIATQRVRVNNVAPTPTLGPGAALNEGQTFTRQGSFSDPGADTWTATVDYGDGSGEQSLALTPGKTFALSHVYAREGTYAATVRVTDDAGAVGTATTTVTVANVAPSVQGGGAASIIQGSAFTRSGSFTDPGADTWSATVDYGDGSGLQGLGLAGNKTFVLSHAYGRAGTYWVNVKVTDNSGATGGASFPVYVAPLPPPPTLLSVTVVVGNRSRD
jgi:photosystem II stability/assembly factor-like uncharacterized protein